MRLVSALYDAPVPAGLALAALVAAGADPVEVGVWPPLPPLAVAPPAAALLAAAADLDGVIAQLDRFGLPADAQQQARSGLERGAILVIARCPDLAAAALAAALAEAGPLGPGFRPLQQAFGSQ